jgi:LysM repeat protein
VRKKRILALLILIILICFPGCADSEIQQSGVNEGVTPQITPYRTATLPEPAVTTAPTPSPLPLPSPTPLMYTVVENDTMIAIAARFGITLDELQVANPEVSPNLLSLGTQLVIPVSFEDQDQTAEPILSLGEGEVDCFPVRTGGVRCYWLVTNMLDQPVENISGVIRLVDQLGQEVSSSSAVTLLNVLEPGMEAPLAAFFEPPVADWQLAQGQITSVVLVNQYEERYLQGRIVSPAVEVAPDGLQAKVSGLLEFTSGKLPEYGWVLAIAYDTNGDIVGVRRWEAPVEQLNNSLEFNFLVFSLGRPIDQVTLQYEARTVDATDSGP